LKVLNNSLILFKLSSFSIVEPNEFSSSLDLPLVNNGRI
jgi:hypothetical protein